MTGELSLLNVGTGDTKIAFDPDAPPEEISKASILVKDMIRRGYAILVEVGKDEKGPLYRRAYDFDIGTTEYIVAGLPEDLVVPSEETESAATPKKERKTVGRRGAYKARAKPTHRVKATGTKAVAVPRTAGG
jgi:hypothetical protein